MEIDEVIKDVFTVSIIVIMFLLVYNVIGILSLDINRLNVMYSVF